MTLPALTAVDFGGPEDAPLLVLGPSLGTSVAALWSNAARLLATRHRVIGFDLPGHGGSPPPVEEDVPSSVELRWRSGEHQAALT